MGRGGNSIISPTAALPDVLLNNVQYSPFLNEAFDAGEFANHALADAPITAQAQSDQLQDGLRLLQEQIATEVSLRQAEMLEQAAQMSEVENAFAGTSLAVGRLQAGLRRVRADIMEPYQQVEASTRQVAALHETVALLRTALQRLKLTAKLRIALSEQGFANSPLDLAKAARLVGDTEAVEKEADLSSLDVIECDSDFLLSARAQISSHAEDLLRRGVDTQSQAQAASALQVFFNLGSLREAVDSEMNRHVDMVTSALSAALDGRKLQAAVSGVVSAGGGRTAATPAARQQDILWGKVAEALMAITSAATAAWHLQRVLAKKKDPLTLVIFADALADAAPSGATAELQTDAMWAQLTAATKKAINGVVEDGVKSSFVKDALVMGYPRLAAALEDSMAKLQRDTQVKGAGAAVTEQQAAALLAATGPLQMAYLAAVMKRLNDSVTATFPGGSRPLPTSAELQKCIGRMHEELKASASCASLAVQTAAAVGASLRLMAERSELMAAGGSEARAVMGPATPAAGRNIALAALLSEVCRSVAGMTPRLPPSAAAVIEAPLESLQSAAIAVVLPLFRAMADTAEELILCIHDDPTSWTADSVPGAVLRPSRYMAKMISLLAHFRSEFLRSIGAAGMAVSLVERLASRVVLFFTRHACLLRPLSDGGKLQLARDAAELEEAVVAHLAAPQAIGRPFRGLKALRSLLFAEIGQLAAATQAAVSALPRVYVSSHLLSRGPPALQSPMSRSGLTPSQYAAWLEQHSALEANQNFLAALRTSPSNAQASDVATIIVRLLS